MIDKWILRNFKSVEDEQELTFRPLTIFTGANSSGKSTILQSILLLTQTMQDPAMSRSVVLNGRLKKFGTYADVAYKRDTQKPIKIGFSLTNGINNLDNESVHYMYGIEKVDFSFQISSKRGDYLHPSMDNCHLTMRMDNIVDSLDVTQGRQPESVKKIIKTFGNQISDNEVAYRVNLNKSKSRYLPSVDLSIFGVGFIHFLPNYLIGYYNRKVRHLNYLSDLITGNYFHTRLYPEELAILELYLVNKCLQITQEVMSGIKTPSKRLLIDYNKVLYEFSLDNFYSFIQHSHLDEDKKQSYLKELKDVIASMDYSYGMKRVSAYDHYPELKIIKDFFTYNIKYLGPLREEPRSLYPLEGNISPEDIGLKGENTAAVLESNKTKKVSYIDPCKFENGMDKSSLYSTGTLAEAVNKWLVYLGVANEISTTDKGKIGHELSILTDVPDMKQDLTHVGVGVSQVLPILVLSFLANTGDTIILEQPELHLHPKVQTRLADFFVSMNALGKQCIIETHSEYMINRLRYLVAISNSTEVADNTMIYFVEKENGHSKYRPVSINKYGVIEDWPDGFFDENEKTAREILSAGMAKKMREDGSCEE